MRRSRVERIIHHPTQEFLRERLDYEPSTGRFFWKVRAGSRGTTIGFGGRQAGGIRNDGYLVICVGSRPTLAHLLAWRMTTGEWPLTDIDHIDGDRANCRWNNLRLATRAQNLWNAKLSPKNTSGFKGVQWHSIGQKWMARFKADKKSYYLGLFNTPEEAYDVYCRESVRVRGEFHRGK